MVKSPTAPKFQPQLDYVGCFLFLSVLALNSHYAQPHSFPDGLHILHVDNIKDIVN